MELYLVQAVVQASVVMEEAEVTAKATVSGARVETVAMAEMGAMVQRLHRVVQVVEGVEMVHRIPVLSQ